MRYHYNNQMSAFYHVFSKAKSIKQKNLVFEKFNRAKEIKEVSIFGNTYSWNTPMLEHKKFEYPAIAPLPIKIDMKIIEDYLSKNNDRWQDNYSSHKGICTNNGKVADATYNQTEHFHLTMPPESYYSDTIATTDMFDQFSARDKLRKNVPLYMDEYSWNVPQPWYENSTLHQELSNKFKSPIIRARLSRMKPGSEVPPHIDYNTTYAIRIILPINGNKGVVNKFWYKGEEIEYEMEEGVPHFLNIGYKHAVYHNGEDTRHYLMLTLGSQEDIECLRLKSVNTIGQ